MPEGRREPVTHIHIPDGVLPFWLWAGGWALAAVLVWGASRVAGRNDVARKVPLLGVVSALVLVAMSLEIVPLAYHLNLTVVAGVLLGPWLGVLAGFIVSVVLALLGHGGITVAGLNVLLLGSEIVLGALLFRAARRVLGRRRVRAAAAFTTTAEKLHATGDDFRDPLLVAVAIFVRTGLDATFDIS